MDNFVIVDKSNDSIHREPNKKSYASTYYKSEGAAKAGITRTIKFYDKAVADVERVIAEGKKEYASRMHNAYRDATDPALGRTHCADRDNYRVMALEEYRLIEPMITKTGTSPYNGKTITRTLSINTPSYMDPLCESHYTR
jgi:hypothetical protein